MTERIYYNDSYLRRFNAQVVACAPGGCTVYLDRTAFYPASGGQPFDLGSIAGVAVQDVVEADGVEAQELLEDGREQVLAGVLLHVVEAAVPINGALDRPGVDWRGEHVGDRVARSEERRVGKECRSRWSPH